MARKPLPINAKNHNGYSADEFKRQLLTWFQDRGLLSDLQAHLRHQMIVALKDTSLNVNSTGSFHQVGSPKLQAINLLVAEFLLRQECHYTLSVFTSEVPLLRNLPEFSCAINDRGTGGVHGAEDQFPGFHERDVFDILEALGFSPNSEESQQVNELYEHSHGEALLTCLIRSLPDKFCSSVKTVCEKPESPEPVNKNEVNEAFLHTPLFTEEIQNLFLELNVGSQQISQLYSAIKRVVEEEVLKAQEVEKVKYHKLLIEREQRIQDLWQKHDEKIQERLVRVGGKLKDKQVKLSRELGQKQAHLAVLAAQLREQQNEVCKRLNYVQERSDLLEQKEVEFKVLKKECEEYILREQQKLEEREKQIEQQLLRLNAETLVREQERKELEANLIQVERASQAIKESHSAMNLLRDMQRHHSLLFEAAEMKYESKEKQPVPSKILHRSSQAVQVDLNKLKGSVAKKHNVQQQTVQVSCEDQSLQTQISGNDMDDIFLHLRVQSTESERRRSQHEMMNNMIEHLEQENSELKGHIAQQRLRIEELTAQTSQLMHHLNQANSLTRLRSQPATHEIHHQSVQTSPMFDSSPAQPVPNRSPPPTSGSNCYQAPPRSVPPGSRTAYRDFVRSNQLGAGEESYFSRKLPPDSHVPLYSPRREHHRKPLRRLTVHSFSSSEESSPSPTEEMLCEARHRLRRLEEETAAVDRSYQEFRLRHVDSLTNTSSILIQPISGEFGAQGLLNTSSAPLVQNLSSTPTSSRSRLLRPQVPLMNKIPSAAVLQPEFLNTTFMYPSSRLSKNIGQLDNPSTLPHNINISTGYPVSAENNSANNSKPWRRPVVSNVQTPLITSINPSSVKLSRNNMFLPAAFNINEQTRHLTVPRDQRNEHFARYQQEPPPCIVSAPHIPIPDTETLADNPSFQTHFAQENVNSRMKHAEKQTIPQVTEPCPPSTDKTESHVWFDVNKDVGMKYSIHNNIYQSLQPTDENLKLSVRERELELSRDELQSKVETSRSKNDQENNAGSEKEASDNTNSCCKKSPEKVSKRNITENDKSPGELTLSVDEDKNSKIENNTTLDNDGKTSSLLCAINDTSKVEVLSEDRECISNKVHADNCHEEQVIDPLKIEGSPPPLNTLDDGHVVLSDQKENTSDREKMKVVSQNVNCENSVCDITVPGIDELVNKNITLDSVSNNMGNKVLNTSSVKSESPEERIENVLLHATQKELSHSPSSPSIMGSSNEVSSDVISAGSRGEEKSDDTW